MSKLPGQYQPYDRTTKFLNISYYQQSEPYNYTDKFPETAYFPQTGAKGMQLWPYYCESEDLNVKLSQGIFYDELYFTSNVEEKPFDKIQPSIEQIKG